MNVPRAVTIAVAATMVLFHAPSPSAAGTAAEGLDTHGPPTGDARQAAEDYGAYDIENPHPPGWRVRASSIDEISDYDRDGRGDLIIGFADNEVEGQFQAGESFIFSSRNGDLLETIREAPPREGAGFGNTTDIGDVTGDGVKDFVVRTRGLPESLYAMYVYDGTSLEVIDLLGDAMSVSPMGDVNGDTTPDIAVTGLGGNVRLLSGADRTLLRDIPSHPDSSGVVIPDVDGDGLMDVAIGAPTAGVNGSGEVYVHSSASGSLLTTIAGPDLSINDEYFGGSFVGLADITGDGRAEIAIGARGMGFAGVYDSVTGSLVTELQPWDRYEKQLYDRLGESIAVIPDATGDIVVGEPGWDRGMYGDDGGAVWLFNGKTGLPISSELPPGGDGANYGYLVAGLTDFNGDGRGDYAAPRRTDPAVVSVFSLDIPSCRGVLVTVSVWGGDSDGGDDALLGTSKRDVMLGSYSADSLIGGSGRDKLCGEGGRDTLDGGKGKDYGNGGGARDLCTAMERQRSCEGAR